MFLIYHTRKTKEQNKSDCFFCSCTPEMQKPVFLVVLFVFSGTVNQQTSIFQSGIPMSLVIWSISPPRPIYSRVRFFLDGCFRELACTCRMRVGFPIQAFPYISTLWSSLWMDASVIWRARVECVSISLLI